MSKTANLNKRIEDLKDQLDDVEHERDELQGEHNLLQRQFSELKRNNVLVATQLAAAKRQIETLEKCVDLIKFMTELRISRDMGLKPSDTL